ncbi:MAG: tetratricopeptide repeat protein, partial [bacterium]|nr:tetratricopeptide repeat protein [bacterium]
LIHGTGGLGKSCLAGKLCERFPNHHLIVLHGKLNALSLQKALHYAFVAADDKKGKEILSEKIEMSEKVQALCASSFKENNYLLLLDDFEQNIAGAEKGAPGALIPEAGALLEVLSDYLPLSAKMTHLLITCRYKITTRTGGEDEALVPVSLTGFLWPEQLKKFRELKHIYQYPDNRVRNYFLHTGCGNPRLMEWLDTLVGAMSKAKVVDLVNSIRDKKEDFIRHHVIRELLKQGGPGVERFLRVCSIYRLPVRAKGLNLQGEAVGLKAGEAGVLAGRCLELSLLELDQARESFEVTPLLREELLTGLGAAQKTTCHRAAFNYYKEVCEALDKEDSYDSEGVEEWIYHALGCGEEETASKEGNKLVGYLRENLAYRESLRVGEWVLAEKEAKKQVLATEFDALLLNELGFTVFTMGDNGKAIGYFEQALKIDRDVFGNKHPNVARELNNLGTVYFHLGQKEKATDYLQQAYDISNEFFGPNHPNTKVVAQALEIVGKEASRQ